MKLKTFTQKELRWDFYPMFLNLMEKGLETEAFLLMLSTWNFARFRYAVRSFQFMALRLLVEDLGVWVKVKKNGSLYMS